MHDTAAAAVGRAHPARASLSVAHWRVRRRARPVSPAQREAALTKAPSALRCRRKFLRFFPDGFHDETYLDWERNYKWEAHERWNESLGREPFRAALAAERYAEVAARAVQIESQI